MLLMTTMPRWRRRPSVRELTSNADLGPGDVLMVHRQMKDKATGKTYLWRFFGLVVTTHGRHAVRLWRIGAKEGQELQQQFIGNHELGQVFFLDPDEWPDGIHVFRTRLILEGSVSV